MIKSKYSISTYSNSILFILRFFMRLIEIKRTINIQIKISIPVHKMVNVIPNGLNQESFGGVINLVPKTRDSNILNIFPKIITLRFTFLEKNPAKITNKTVIGNKKAAFGY